MGHYAEYAKDLAKFMNEVWRIAENGAKATIVAPYYTSMRAWLPPWAGRQLSSTVPLRV